MQGSLSTAKRVSGFSYCKEISPSGEDGENYAILLFTGYGA